MFLEICMQMIQCICVKSIN